MTCFFTFFRVKIKKRHLLAVNVTKFFVKYVIKRQAVRLITSGKEKRL